MFKKFSLLQYCNILPCFLLNILNPCVLERIFVWVALQRSSLPMQNQLLKYVTSVLNSAFLSPLTFNTSTILYLNSTFTLLDRSTSEMIKQSVDSNDIVMFMISKRAFPIVHHALLCILDNSCIQKVLFYFHVCVCVCLNKLPFYAWFAQTYKGHNIQPILQF